MDQPAGKKLKFAVLVTGNSNPEIEEEFGDYGELYKALLADPDLDEEWHVFYPVNNHFPTDDDLKDFKGIILTGSRHDAYATDEWNLKLRELIKTAHSRQQRILGHCFGCQITTIVLGGTVGKAPTGYEGGSRKIHTTPDFDTMWYAEQFEERPEFNLHETHFDIITKPAPGMKVLGYGKNTPVQMCCVGDHFLGLQGHPEFTDKYMEADLKERMATGNLPKEVAEAALCDLKENPVTPEAWRDMQKLLKTFLKVDHERAEVYDVKALRS
ncbi:g2247 [Coccomyxa elongata]